MLITDEGKLKCPRCETVQDILSYTRLKQINLDETVPVIKCGNCRFVFAPLVIETFPVKKD